MISGKDYAENKISRAALNGKAIFSELVGDDVTVTQFYVLAALDTPAETILTLGKRASVDRSTLTDVVGRLTERGYVAWCGEANGCITRSHYIERTAAGTKAYERNARIFDLAGQAMLDVLGSPAAQRKFMEQLNVVVNSIERKSAAEFLTPK